MTQTIKVTRYTHSIDMAYQAKLSTYNSGVSRYGKTPEDALANLAKDYDITGIEVVTDETPLKKVVVKTTGEGRFKTSRWASE